MSPGRREIRLLVPFLIKTKAHHQLTANLQRSFELQEDRLLQENLSRLEAQAAHLGLGHEYGLAGTTSSNWKRREEEEEEEEKRLISKFQQLSFCVASSLFGRHVGRRRGIREREKRTRFSSKGSNNRQNNHHKGDIRVGGKPRTGDSSQVSQLNPQRQGENNNSGGDKLTTTKKKTRTKGVGKEDKHVGSRFDCKWRRTKGSYSRDIFRCFCYNNLEPVIPGTESEVSEGCVAVVEVVVEVQVEENKRGTLFTLQLKRSNSCLVLICCPGETSQNHLPSLPSSCPFLLPERHTRR